MTSPEEFQHLEQQLTRALRAHGDAVEPSPDAYTRLARAVASAPARNRRIGDGFARLRGDGGPAVIDARRPLAFLAAVLAVAGIGGYGLFRLASSPADTATAAPATADVSGLVPEAGESPVDDDTMSVEADGDGTASSPSETPMADSVDSSPRSSVPSDAASSGTAAAAASDPVERYEGLTYAPVRVSGLEAAEAFLDLLAVDGVHLEDRGKQVIVRAGTAPSSQDATGDESIITTLTIAAIGDGFMVVDARSDRLGLAIDNATTADPGTDDVVDDAVVVGPLELSGTTAHPTTQVAISLRSVIDGSVLAETTTSPEPDDDDVAGYRSTISVTGAERAWVVAAAGAGAAGVPSVAARPVLYTGPPDPAGYTVVGIPPDDADGGLVVRSTPSGQRIGVIELGSSNVRRRPVPPRLVDDLVWWAVADKAGLEGWAAARYLAIDETPAESTMVELARAVITAVTDREPAAVENVSLSKPFFVGSVVDPRPISGLADLDALVTTKRRLNSGIGRPAALADIYGFDRWSEAEVFVPKNYRQEGADEAARAYFGDLPSVVIRSLDPDTGRWERVHLFVSRRRDHPMLVGMVIETEPPPNAASAADEPATPPLSGDDS